MKQASFTLKIFFFILALAFGAAFYQTRAQTTNDFNSPSLPSLIPGLEEQISVNVDPVNPSPNQPVTITLQAFGTDLNRANISWLVNGGVAKNGVGATEFDFIAGKSGSLSIVDIIILPVNGSKTTKEVRIAPASVDIAWQSTSYVPPFYKGKQLYPPEGSLIFVALPNLVQNGVSIDPKNLIYNWTLNGEKVADRSGAGKNTFTFVGDVLNQPVSVDVEASSIDNTVVGDGSITLASTNPQVNFYEDSPLYGILFNNSLRNQYNLTNTELNLAAYPYYFSAKIPQAPNLNYSWSVNSNPVSLPAHQNEVVFRKTDNNAGHSSISLSVANSAQFLQSAGNNLMINFSAANINTNNVTF